jgi:hypothetical protein
MSLLNKNLLPKNVLQLINEYSKPLTRPNWRESKPIVTTYKLYKLLYNTSENTKYNSLIIALCLNIVDTEWYYMFIMITYNGWYVELFANERFDNDYNKIIKIDGIKDALNKYNSSIYKRK